MKRKLFFDMDGTLVDFMSGVSKVDKAIVEKYEGHYDDIPGVFAAHLQKRGFNYPYILHTLYMKKGRSVTPLS